MRVFKDNATYENPAIWIDSKNQIWTGPLSPDDNMHFARFCGFMADALTPIWILYSSECPGGCVLVGFVKIVEQQREDNHECQP